MVRRRATLTNVGTDAVKAFVAEAVSLSDLHRCAQVIAHKIASIFLSIIHSLK